MLARHTARFTRISDNLILLKTPERIYPFGRFLRMDKKLHKTVDKSLQLWYIKITVVKCRQMEELWNI